MREMFVFLIINMVKFGQVEKATFYDEEFATVELMDGEKKYKISMRCEDAEDGNIRD